ncbi:hypothetical protein G5V57_24225 [Nordella sp. HKS 07]|uniref:hypothetical protein n=1 Tax=Nordella sp. HKS 07 TaxID=2712222 RepID=UPI0013E1784E|nr:hypothetical protein [Nordella sp. HKS 07]QIG50561.1 hypothetical protein G5V57_24225 [Nordella sp. HKS 07]
MDLVKELEKIEKRKLAAAIEEIRAVLWRPKQTLPQARHEIALILKDLKED